MYLKASISDFRVYRNPQLLTQSEIGCLYTVDKTRPVMGDRTTFNRDLAQYIDGGPRLFNISGNARIRWKLFIPS